MDGWKDTESSGLRSLGWQCTGWEEALRNPVQLPSPVFYCHLPLASPLTPASEQLWASFHPLGLWVTVCPRASLLPPRLGTLGLLCPEVGGGSCPAPRQSSVCGGQVLMGQFCNAQPGGAHSVCSSEGPCRPGPAYPSHDSTGTSCVSCSLFPASLLLVSLCSPGPPNKAPEHKVPAQSPLSVKTRVKTCSYSP